MSDETDTTSEVARVLDAHALDPSFPGDRRALRNCRCGWVVANTADHANHQAAMLAEAGLLREDAGLDDRVPVFEEPKRRLRACVENWADAETGEYDPSCCRFPKSCSATVYSEEHVTEDDLEPQIATQEPAGATQGGSGDSRASGGLGERLRALVAGPHPDVLIVRTAEGEWLGIVAEVERLEGKHARQAQTIGELQEVRERLTRQVEAIRAAITREAAHGEAITRCNLVAERFQTVLDSVSAP